ncbi:hypothetical protein JAAARDRAFT_188481 [Jaapia argillacea MUCL 33604]|uniref:Uncharacterized protein n=1 Tax=Jaapia argillacea MUCL 33604 TaxID=933084 RepID=A0A067QDV1_9AGAM|nr:hypothetical protein JAAARDRAFT_188481 [Jaapia argillacea MUCL 33604]
MLKNFMDLVCAILLANMQTISKGHINAYRLHIQRYLETMKSLYKDIKIKPTHHASLHVGDFLELFGLVQSHSAPFFKRYIHFLQSQNTNLKFVFLVMEEYTPVDHSNTDGRALDRSYRQFGFAGGFICYPSTAGSHIIEDCDVVSHFAKTPMKVGEREFLHVLPLNHLMEATVIVEPYGQ